jgi:hypothetical protein
MFHLRQKNYISNIQIEDIRITKLLLNSDGAPATFVALIGSMVDYLVNESSGLILKNEDKTIFRLETYTILKKIKVSGN